MRKSSYVTAILGYHNMLFNLHKLILNQRRFITKLVTIAASWMPVFIAINILIF